MKKLLGFLALVLLALPSAAQAYIGPGLGVAVAWTLLGPLAALIVAVGMIAYFPLRYWYKKRQKEKNKVREIKPANDPAPKDPDSNDPDSNDPDRG